MIKRKDLFTVEQGIEALQTILAKHGNIPLFVNGEYGTENMVIPIEANFSVGAAELELGNDFEFVSGDVAKVLEPEEMILSIGGW